MRKSSRKNRFPPGKKRTSGGRLAALPGQGFPPCPPHRTLHGLVPLAGVLLILLHTGCTTPGDMHHRRRTSRPTDRPRAVPTESRMAVSQLPLDQHEFDLLALMYTLLNRLGFQIETSHPDDQTTRLDFRHSEVRGYIVVGPEQITPAGRLLHYAYRVQVARFPATTTQARHVDALADYLTALFAHLRGPASSGPPQPRLPEGLAPVQR